MHIQTFALKVFLQFFFVVKSGMIAANGYGEKQVKWRMYIVHESNFIITVKILTFPRVLFSSRFFYSPLPLSSKEGRPAQPLLRVSPRPLFFAVNVFTSLFLIPYSLFIFPSSTLPISSFHSSPPLLRSVYSLHIRASAEPPPPSGFPNQEKA